MKILNEEQREAILNKEHHYNNGVRQRISLSHLKALLEAQARVSMAEGKEKVLGDVLAALCWLVEAGTTEDIKAYTDELAKKHQVAVAELEKLG